MIAEQLAHLPNPDYSTHPLPLASWEYDVLCALHLLTMRPLRSRGRARYWQLSRNARRIYDQLIEIRRVRR